LITAKLGGLSKLIPESKKIEKHILLSSLSTNPRKAIFSFCGKTAEVNQSPITMMQLLLPEKLHQEIIVLCTRALEEQFGQVKEIIKAGVISSAACGSTAGTSGADRQIAVRILLIPNGKTTEELWGILYLIRGAVPPGCCFTLDLTHGYRSFPFLYFTAAMFLKALYGVQIKAVYYGMLESAATEKPIVGLSLLLDMVEWFN
jgi:CRISPR-associated DxTHG motif protein